VSAPKKSAPAGRQKAAPHGVYHFFRLALERLGANEFCSTCFAYVLPGHSVHQRTAPFRPTTVTLAGGLDGPQAASQEVA
jgi:hypothetical protein